MSSGGGLFCSLLFLISFFLYADGTDSVGDRASTEGDGSEYYRQAMELLNVPLTKRRQNANLAFDLLLKAGRSNHTKALEMIAYAHLFGDTLPQDLDAARRIFEALNKVGSVKAQTGLGFMHSSGFGVNSSQATALVYYTFAAYGRNPWAQMALGYRYLYGINVVQGCEGALTYYRRVADEVVDLITYGVGTAVQRIRLSDEIEDPSASSLDTMEENLLQYYKFLAEKGDLGAQVGLGQLFLTGGRGVEQNFDLAKHYFFMAADAGSANALGFLGKMYLEGTGATPADNLTAFQYFKRASDKGNPVGQSGLGYMYMTGLGVEVDLEKAYKLLNAAAEQGNVEAQVQLGTMFYKGLGIARDYQLALKYFQLASQSGSVMAMYNLGLMHALGIGVMRSCHTAVEFFKNVAERGKWSSMLMEAYQAYQRGRLHQALAMYLFMADLGYEVAQSNAAYILDKGELSFEDASEQNQRALLLWDRAANQGSGFARLKVADYHYYGKGTPVDYEEAISNYKLASELQRNPQAMFNLGYMHEQGIGIRRDLHLAKRFYDMALEVNPDAALPVNLALLKLSLLFAADLFQQSFWWKLEFMDRAFGPHWDLYIIPLICAIIAGLYTLRRHSLQYMLLLLAQQQTRLKSFFTRSTAENLWKSVTSVSNVGRKKGRARSVARRKDLNRGQEIGKGGVNTLWPGLNAPVMAGRTLLKPRYLPPDTQREQRLQKLREGVRSSKQKVHPLERGWSGTSLMGRKLGPPPCLAEDQNAKDFMTIVLQTKSVRHMTARLGLVRRVSLLAVVGNGDGLAGFAFAKQPDAKAALRKASNMAAKRLAYVHRLHDRTIFQDFWGECRSTQLFVQRTAEGQGLRCHRAMKAICQAVGISDLYARVEGNTSNYLALARVFFDGLLKQETFQDLAERKRLLVVEFRKERLYYPVIVARPLLASLRTDSELDADEILDVDELYAEGRYPYRRPNRQPFWINYPSYLKKLWMEKPYRNLDEVKIRLMADDIIADDTTEALKKRKLEVHQAVVQGAKPIPMGIGLTAVIQNNL